MSSGSPEISIVIPIFRSGPILRDTLESVLAQNFKNYEVILVDNNASENTKNCARSFSQRHPGIFRIIHEENQGRSAARNTGIEMSRGKFIALLDDDDLMSEDRLSTQLDAMKKYPTCSIIHSVVDCVDFHETHKVVYTRFPGHDFYNKNLYKYVNKFNAQPCSSPISIPFTASTMFFRRDIAQKVGLFDLSLDPLGPEDHEFALRMFFEGPYYMLRKSVVRYRLSSIDYTQRKTSNTTWVQGLISTNNMFVKLKNILKNEDDKSLVQKGLRRMKASWLREFSKHFLQYKNGKDYGKQFVFESIKNNPADFRTMKDLIRYTLPNEIAAKSFGLSCSNETLPDRILDLQPSDFFNERIL